MAQRLRFVLDGDDNLSPVLNRAGDSSTRLHRRLNDDMSGNAAAVRSFTQDANGRLRDLRGRFLSVADSSRLMGAGLPDLTRRLGDVGSAGSDTAMSLGRSGGGLSGVMAGVAAVAGLSLLPAIGALVPMMAGAGLAAGTLKLGFAGVSEAMEAAGKSKEEYAEALEKLSPPAREFTKALVGVKKEFSGVGKEIQKAMLPGFTKAVKESAPVVKILGKGMTELGGAFGKAAEGAGRLFRDSGFQKDLQANLDLGRLFVGDMLSGLGRLGRSFLSFGAASKPTLTALSGGIRDVLGKGLPGMFDGLKVGIEGSSKFLAGFFNMINSLLPAIGRFSGEVARALGPLLGQMFTSLGVQGAGALDMLGQVVKGLTPVFKDLGYGLRATTDLIRIIGPTVRDTAGAIVGSLLPSFSRVDQARGPLQRLSDAIRSNKGAIQEGARVFGNVMIEMVRGAVNAVPPIIRAWKLVSLGILEAIGVAVGAASKLWGWVPGIGGKLRAANEAFNRFKDGYIGTLDTAERKANDFAASTSAKLSRNQLKMNINNWSSQIETAKAKLKTVPPSKQAALKASIKDLQAKVAAARTMLNNLDGKTATTRILTIRETRAVYNTVGRPTQGEGGVSKYAAGGTPAAGEMAMVGENGPELVVFGEAARVFDASKTKAMLGGTLTAGRAAAQGLAAGLGSTSGVRAAARTMAAAVTAGIREELQIASPSKKTKALAKDVGKGFIDGLTGSRAKIKAVAADLAKDIKAAFSGKKESALLKMVSAQTKKLLDAAAKRDKVAAKIAEAKAYASDVTKNAREGAGLSNLGMEPEQVTAGGIKAGLAQKLAQIKQFTKYIGVLAKRGLNKGLIRQILNMGPEAGYAYANALAGADKATFSQINNTQSMIDKETKKLGMSGADILYDSGKNAGKGFLKGLEGQKKDIEKLMLDIATGMQKAIKKALGIKSPSTVMARLGMFSTQGLARGLVGAMPTLDSALAAVSGRVAATQPVLGRPVVAGRGGGGMVVHIHVDGAVVDALGAARAVREALLELKRTNGGADLGIA